MVLIIRGFIFSTIKRQCILDLNLKPPGLKVLDGGCGCETHYTTVSGIVVTFVLILLKSVPIREK